MTYEDLLKRDKVAGKVKEGFRKNFGAVQYKIIKAILDSEYAIDSLMPILDKESRIDEIKRMTRLDFCEIANPLIGDIVEEIIGGE